MSKATLANEAMVVDPDSGLENIRLTKQIKVDAALAGDNVIVAAVANRRIRLTAQSLSMAGDVTVSWKSGIGGTSVELIPARTFKAGGGIDGCWGPHGYYCRTEVGKALNLYLGGAVQVSGTINYIEE